ncbi:hypothetical protein E3O47_07580 [Cryobacterium sp. TMT2-17-1]|uniref:hypothetical protein n=1 Tax=Cryobacterium sp. TMT2-17-1 TaxID=1259248 RepID=UPI00106A3A9C|nr:hypothetical protein [Cryobacterium sp. TMT2-17-1]TFC50860.1 hypothetical protein E3O47_07580 [Cryobacterium sp. TMT2-17-1]
MRPGAILSDRAVRACDRERADRCGAPIILRLGPAAARRKQAAAAIAVWLANAYADGQILAFWQAFADAFRWDFLPVDFPYVLYAGWMTEAFPPDVPFLKKAFIRRIKVVATASGEWGSTPARAPGR